MRSRRDGEDALSSTSNISPNEAEGKQEPTIEELLQLAPALKKAALEYGAREESGKVTFPDETCKQAFLKIAKALLGAGERKFSKAWHGVSNVIVRGDEFGSYRDIKELRKKAIAYYQKHLQGTSVENARLGKVDIDHIGLVEFTGEGRKKAKSTSAKEEKLLVIKYLPKLIRGANNITESSAEKESHADDYFYYLHTSAEINGRTIPVDITLIKHNNGRIQYYNHTLPTFEISNKKESPVTAEPVSSKEALGTLPVGNSITSNIPLGKEESKQEKLLALGLILCIHFK